MDGSTPCRGARRRRAGLARWDPARRGPYSSATGAGGGGRAESAAASSARWWAAASHGGEEAAGGGLGSRAGGEGRSDAAARPPSRPVPPTLYGVPSAAAEEQGDGDGELEDRKMGGGLHRRPPSLRRSVSCRGGGRRWPPTDRATMAELGQEGKEADDEWAPLGRSVF